MSISPLTNKEKLILIGIWLLFKSIVSKSMVPTGNLLIFWGVFNGLIKLKLLPLFFIKLEWKFRLSWWIELVSN